jgi:3-phosphoshikimate 1-carboxyvinyltransferase
MASSIRGGQKLHGLEARIPGDISSAAFFLCAAALFPGSQLVVRDLLMNPTRSRLLDVLTAVGLNISVTQLEEQNGELVGTLQASGGNLKGIRLSGAESAALIDEIPVLAAIAPYTEDGAEIRDARELRVKESDRIGAVTSNLRRMGAQVEEFEDGFSIPGEQRLHGTTIDSFGDHRIAMAFAVAALGAEGDSVIRGAESAEISYPEFFDTLAGLAQR